MNMPFTPEVGTLHRLGAYAPVNRPIENPLAETHTYKGVQVLTEMEALAMSAGDYQVIKDGLVALTHEEREAYNIRCTMRAAAYEAWASFELTPVVEPEPEPEGFVSWEDAEAYRDLHRPQYSQADIDRIIGAAYNLLYKPLTKGASMEPWYLTLWGNFTKATADILKEDEDA